MNLSIEEQIRIGLEGLWRLVDDPRVSGLGPYEVARMIGMNPDLARRVVERWDGPSRFGPR